MKGKKSLYTASKIKVNTSRSDNKTKPKKTLLVMTCANIKLSNF